jgi:polysaccharide biosynthesis/export protein
VVKRFTSFRTILGMCLALLVASPVLAQPAAPAKAPVPAASPAPGSQVAARTTGDSIYILGLGDVVQVSVLGRSDFDVRGRIGSDGAVLLPYLGAVTAVGRTPAQLAEDVRIALEKGGYYAQPVVRVELVTVASRYVTVLGNVVSPGLVPLDRDYRLSELIARAGGRSPSGANQIILTRANGTSETYSISDLGTAGPDKDPVLAPGDKIFVPTAENEVFYVTGQVRSPGAYQVSTNMTVRMALARGGGVTENGNEKKPKIIRKGTPLKDVKIDETLVEPGDIIVIGERMF